MQTMRFARPIQTALLFGVLFVRDVSDAVAFAALPFAAQDTAPSALAYSAVMSGLLVSKLVAVPASWPRILAILWNAAWKVAIHSAKCIREFASASTRGMAVEARTPCSRSTDGGS